MAIESWWLWPLFGLALAINLVGTALVWRKVAERWGRGGLVGLVLAMLMIAGITVLMRDVPMLLSLVAAPGIVYWKIYSMEKAKARERALAGLAAELGLAFSAKDPAHLARRYAGFTLLGTGKDQVAYNVLQGQRAGRRVAAFDFQYVTGSGDNRCTHNLSVVIATVGGSLGDLLIRPERLGDKLKAAVGAEDIDFESHEFSSKFYVRSRDRKLAYDVISPQVMDYLLARPGWTIEARGCDVMLTNGEVLAPEQVREAIAVLEGFLSLIPRFVWKELGEGR